MRFAVGLGLVILAASLDRSRADDPRPTPAPAQTPAARPAPKSRPEAPGPKNPAPPAAKPAAAPAPAAATTPAPQVVSRAKQKQQGRSSEFLRPQGDDRYGNAEADADLPPWRQTTFFGVRAKGSFFVYVVDCSGSMVLEDRLARAKEEIRRSVRGLVEPQRFHVIFYNDQAIPMPGGLPRSASLLSKTQLLEWLRLIEPDGETDPRPALGTALSLRPDAVFLLSDGEFPDGTAEGVARSNPRKIPIHCIDLSSGEAGEQLRQIAHDSGGKFLARPPLSP